jgi:hypothetical protein
MTPLSQSLAPWHDFYTLLGAASATMIGLLFVAVSVGSGVFTENRRGALRMFLSASVVQFGSVLTGCLLVLAPLQHWMVLGAAVMVCGSFGVVFSAMAWRDVARDGIVVKIDLEDRVWYALAPAIGYLIEVAAGMAMLLRRDAGCTALAVAMGTMLVVAIHNAWDITVWTVTRRKD